MKKIRFFRSAKAPSQSSIPLKLANFLFLLIFTFSGIYSYAQCSGTPTAGTDGISPSSGGPGTLFALSITGEATGSGISNQWEVSTTSATAGFAPIYGAVSNTYSFTGISQNSWYRCLVICSGSGITSVPTAVMATAVCSGTPSAGTDAVYPAAGNESSTFVLSASGESTGGSGMFSYQWGESTAGASGPFTAITGANAPTYTLTGGISQNTWFACTVTCTGSGLTASPTPVEAVYLYTISPTTFTTIYNPWGDTFATPYTYTSNSTVVGGGCFDVTQDVDEGQGAIWSYSTLDFTNPFEVTFQATVGGSAQADGFCAVFGQSFTPTSPPDWSDANLGYYSLNINGASPDVGLPIGPTSPAYTTNSLGVEFDIFNDNYAGAYTYNFDDIPDDHVAICQNADPTTPLAGPTAINGTAGIKDLTAHPYKITWVPITGTTTGTLSVYGFASPSCTALASAVYSYSAYPTPSAIGWGFTGSTGGLSSVIEICNITATPQTTQTVSACTSAVLSAPTAAQTATMTFTFPPPASPTYTSWLWSTGATTSSITVTTSGTYMVTEFTSCGDMVQEIFNVTINSIPSAFTVSYTPTVVCAGTAWQLTNTSACTTCTYNWTGEAITATTQVLSEPIMPSATTAMDGVYGLTITNSAGCSTTASVTVTVTTAPAPPSISGPSSICAGVATTYTGTPTGGSWTTTGALSTPSPTTGGITSIEGSPGSGGLKYTVTNACGSNGTTETITVVPPPAPAVLAPIPPSQICIQGIFTASITPGVSGAYTVSCSAFPPILGISTLSPTYYRFTGNALGTTTVTFTVVSAAGCTGTTSFTVSVVGSPTVAAISGPSTVCTNSTVTLTDATPGGSWSSSNTSIATVNNLTGVVRGKSCGTATITYEVSNACGNAFAYHTMTVIATPTVTAVSSPSVICAGNTATLTATATAGCNATISYLWAGSSLLCTSCNPTFADPDSYQMYTVTASVGACTSTATTTVNIIPEPVISCTEFSLTATPTTGVTITYQTGYALGGGSFDWTSGILGGSVPVPLGYGDYNAAEITSVSYEGCTWPDTCISEANMGRQANANSTTSGNPQDMNIRLIPNPNKGVFAITGYVGIVPDGKLVQLKIINNIGQIVYADNAIVNGGSINKNVSLDLGIPNGVYLVKVETGSNSQVIRFTLDR